MTTALAALTRQARHDQDLIAAYDACIGHIHEFDLGCALASLRDEHLRQLREINDELIRLGGVPLELGARHAAPPGFEHPRGIDSLLRALLELEGAAAGGVPVTAGGESVVLDRQLLRHAHHRDELERMLRARQWEHWSEVQQHG